MISTTCPDCSERMAVPVGRSRVVVDPGGDLLVLRCPGCDGLVTKPLTPRLTTVLLRQGAIPTPTPLRPPHPEQPDAPDAPSFTAGDVRLAHERLRETSTVGDLLDLMTGDAGSTLGVADGGD